LQQQQRALPSSFLNCNDNNNPTRSSLPSSFLNCNNNNPTRSSLPSSFLNCNNNNNPTRSSTFFFPELQQQRQPDKKLYLLHELQQQQQPNKKLYLLLHELQQQPNKKKLYQTMQEVRQSLVILFRLFFPRTSLNQKKILGKSGKQSREKPLGTILLWYLVVAPRFGLQ
jgi:hypothetical protein